VEGRIEPLSPKGGKELSQWTRGHLTRGKGRRGKGLHSQGFHYCTISVRLVRGGRHKKNLAKQKGPQDSNGTKEYAELRPAPNNQLTPGEWRDWKITRKTSISNGRG